VPANCVFGESMGLAIGSSRDVLGLPLVEASQQGCAIAMNDSCAGGTRVSATCAAGAQDDAPVLDGHCGVRYGHEPFLTQAASRGGGQSDQAWLTITIRRCQRGGSLRSEREPSR
jgi:hypothetical protein